MINATTQNGEMSVKIDGANLILTAECAAVLTSVICSISEIDEFDARGVVSLTASIIRAGLNEARRRGVRIDVLSVASELVNQISVQEVRENGEQHGNQMD